MNESDYTRTITKALRQCLPREALVIKTTDLFTAGLPDFFVSRDGVVTWFEAKKPARVEYKMFSPVPTVLFYPRKQVEALQWEMLCRLQRSYVLLYTEKGFGMAKVAEFESVEVRLYKLGQLVVKILEATRT